MSNSNKRIDNLSEFYTGNLEKDGLSYLCLTEESRSATLAQIANDLVELHRLQEAEQQLGTDLTRSKLSAAENMIRQKHSVERIARDLVELQMKLASMGNFYTLSFLERYYKSMSERSSGRNSARRGSEYGSEFTAVSPLHEVKNSTTVSSLNRTNNQSSFSTNILHQNSVNVQQSRATSNYLSDIEQAILKSVEPVRVDETEIITVNGEEGVWTNKLESLDWKGDLPLEDYEINQDDDPEIVYKKSEEVLDYVQELAVRYLRPPTPPQPGDIIITQEADSQTQPAPPIIIRQQPPRPETPEPLVIREAPPTPPPHVEKKVIKISGKKLPPEPRRVIIERLAPLPTKPQPVIVERWLPYPQQKRKVIFSKSSDELAIRKTPKNLIIQWEEPQVQIRKEFKYLGAIKMEPDDYKQTYGNDLMASKDLPDYVNQFKNPDGLVLAADQTDEMHELEGDIFALKMIDLEKEGLEKYAAYLNEYNDSDLRASVLTHVENSVTEQAQLLDSNMDDET